MSSSTENVYLVKTSVIFKIRRHDGWTEGRTMKEKFIPYEDGHFIVLIRRAFYVYSGGFKRILQTYLEIQRVTISLPCTTDSGHGF